MRLGLGDWSERKAEGWKLTALHAGERVIATANRRRGREMHGTPKAFRGLYKRSWQKWKIPTFAKPARGEFQEKLGKP